MRRFTPNLEKNLKKELATALRPVVLAAKGFVPAESPMSGWAGRSYSEGRFPTWNSSIVKAGIVYRTSPSKINSNGFSGMASIQNRSRVGSIYESAGRKHPNGQPWVGPKTGTTSNKVSKSVNPKAGEQFIKNLPPLVSSLKGRGRLIYKAWAQNQGRAEGAAMKAIDKALRQFEIEAAKAPLGKAA
jgi:hypothetical protein